MCTKHTVPWCCDFFKWFRRVTRDQDIKPPSFHQVLRCRWIHQGVPVPSLLVNGKVALMTWSFFYPNFVKHIDLVDKHGGCDVGSLGGSGYCFDMCVFFNETYRSLLKRNGFEPL